MRTILVFSALTICTTLSAQTEKPTREIPELVTDRPDYTESVDVVGPGFIQSEHGITLDREGDVRSITAPELLMRIGLTKRIELRLGSDGFLVQKSPAGVAEGRSDTEIAVKINIFKQSHFRPGFSLIPIVSLPSGDQRFSSLGYDPTIKFAWDKDFGAGFTLGGNVNFSSVSAEGGRFQQRAYSWSLGHDLPAGFGAYWEVFGFTPWEKDGQSAWIVNTGVSHGLGKNAQVDARVGKRMTDAGPNWFVGVGFAVRRPMNWFGR